jgi:GNAT superfamily N-acetyltransferase
VGAHAPPLEGFRGVYVWMREEGCVISAPQDLLMDIASCAGGRSLAEVIEGGALASVLGDRVERMIGPAVISYADTTDFILHDEQGARPLIPSDDDALRALSEEVGEDAWENSNIAFDRVPVFGIYDQHKLVAAASYERWGERILHVGILTHPEHRGQGLGLGVAAATVTHALEAGGIAQYQTLEANEPSMRIADKLGFKRYCRTLVFRLR